MDKIPRHQLSPYQNAQREMAKLDATIIEQNLWIFELIVRITEIRRGINVPTTFSKFKEILEKHVNSLDQLDNRWISSVLDTYIDHGDEQQQYEAMILNSYYLQGRLAHLALKTFGGKRNGIDPSNPNDKLNNNLARLERIIKLPLFRKIMQIAIRTEVSDHYIVRFLVTRSPKYEQVVKRMNDG